MPFKDYIILTAGCLLLGGTLVNSHPIQPIEQPKIDTPITINVKNKRALFIGDSHTANHSFGWQKLLSQQVGFKYANVSISGKTTYWMLNMAVYKLNKDIDYCFIYGGANDMYSNNITPEDAFENIKGMARICKKNGIKCVVLTGFDAKVCTRTSNPRYVGRYAKFQELLLGNKIDGAVVVDTRVVLREDCGDNLCHMKLSGHKKVAEKVIKDLALQKI